MDIEKFGQYKLEFLRSYPPYSNGIPSDDTLRRFFRAMDPKLFSEKFREWVKSLGEIGEQVIALDGKTSRGSRDGDKNPLHLVSAFASEARLILAQKKVDEKSNEITAIPELLEWLDLRGATITIDAMGCKKSIAEKIYDGGGQYVLSLKGNHGQLHEDVKFDLVTLLRTFRKPSLRPRFADLVFQIPLFAWDAVQIGELSRSR